MIVKTFCYGPDEIDDELNKWLRKHDKAKILKILSPTISTTKEMKDKVCIVIFYNEPKQINIPIVSPNRSHKCPNCNSVMMVRANSNTGDLFWGCSKFPNCRGMRAWEEEDWKLVTGGKDPGPSKNNSTPGDPGYEDDIPF